MLPKVPKILIIFQFVLKPRGCSRLGIALPFLRCAEGLIGSVAHGEGSLLARVISWVLVASMAALAVVASFAVETGISRERVLIRHSEIK